jgi:dTDP-glucose 4,6-dehydratase
MIYQGTPVTIARLFNNYGPGQQQNRLVPAIVSSLKQGKALRMTGAGTQTRDWIDVRDTCSALQSLLEMSEGIGGTYNICAENELSVRQVLDIFEGASGRYARIVNVPSIDGYLRRSAGSAAKLLTATGWRPTRTLNEYASEVFERGRATI